MQQRQKLDKRMQILLILVSVLLTGCANWFAPKFPGSVKNHYMLRVPGIAIPLAIADLPAEEQQIQCLKLDIVSTKPYTLKFNSVVSITECAGVGGWKPSDSKTIINWVDDVISWMDKQNCFVNF